MLLAIDIGNTNISLGAFEFPKLTNSWRLHTDRSRTADEYALLMRSMMDSASADPREFTSAIVGSVVPPLTPTLTESISIALGFEALTARSDAVPGTRALVDNPPEVGIDRIANCVAAHEFFGGPALVVDFGTTTNFDVTTPEGDYIGGVIAPGISMSVESLYRGASQLPRIQFRRPDKIIGTNTVACMESGVYWGYVYLIREMIESISEELETKPRVIATGGLATMLADEIGSIDDIAPDLTLHGLAIIHERIKADAA